MFLGQGRDHRLVFSFVICIVSGRMCVFFDIYIIIGYNRNNFNTHIKKVI